MQDKKGVGNGDNRRIVSSWNGGGADQRGHALERVQRAGEVGRYYPAATEILASLVDADSPYGDADVKRGERIMRGFVILATSVLLAGCSQPPQSNTAVESTEATQSTPDAGKLWVTTQYADRHSCPSDECGIVGRLFFREAATPMQTKDGWVRITKTYDASCQNGESQYVDKGNDACTTANGITNGQFAEWVKESQLSVARPADPAETASADESIVADSDDFTQYRTAFAKVARELIASGRCTAEDFKEQGGWVKSVNQRDEPVYFTYCGGMTAANKIYMNAETGTVM